MGFPDNFQNSPAAFFSAKLTTRSMCYVPLFQDIISV